MKLRFWASWYLETGLTLGNWEPESVFPVHKDIKGYWLASWVDGEMESSVACLVAVVEGNTEMEALQRILDYWKVEDWRFFDQVANNWMPNPARFPTEQS